MSDKKEDRRVQRTRTMLHEALLDLIVEKGYEAITVQDLIDRANIGRSTFYFHFVDKEELLVDTINRTREFLKEQMSKRTIAEETGRTSFGFSLAILQHVQSHKQIYRATVGKQSGALVLHHMQRMITDLAREEIEMQLSSSDSSLIPQDLAVEFVVNTLMTLMIWWMDRNAHYSAYEMDRMFHQLILNGIGWEE